MSSQQETPIITHTVILASLNNWDKQIKVIKRKANANQIWKYIDLSTSKAKLLKLEKPTKPKPKNVNSQKIKFLKLDKDKKEEF